MTEPLAARHLNRYCRQAREIALGAGRILRRGFAHGMMVEYKGRIDPVTEYDLKSEAYIVTRLRKFFPEHDILTEEGSNTDSASACRWVIDPLDGTVNFAHGFPLYCVSIGLQYNGESVVAAVYDPEREEMFWAIRGQGAFINRRRIYVSEESRLERALVATGFAYDIATARRNNLGLFSRMAKQVQGVRRPGSAAIDLCWLAQGRLDGFWELHLRPWDTAAAILIVNEAGGKTTRLDGRPYSIFDSDLLAANDKLHLAMRRLLSGPGKTRQRRR